MKKYTRLPKGYKQKVAEIKLRYIRMAKNFQSSEYGFSKKLAWLESVEDSNGDRTYLNINAYTNEETREHHISFDYDIINSEIVYNTRTKRYRILDTCTVFIEGKNGETIGFVDSYRW